MCTCHLIPKQYRPVELRERTGISIELGEELGKLQALIEIGFEVFYYVFSFDLSFLFFFCKYILLPSFSLK